MSYQLATSTWDKSEINAIHRVIESGMYSMGKEVAIFEKQFAEFTNSKHCLMVNSGSSANLIMVGAMFYKKKNAWKAGDEVIVPAVSWPTTYYPLYQYGLKLKFVDIDVETLNFDLGALESAITDKTRGILAVNLLGNPNDFAKIQTMIKGKNITLLEDNCESLAATFQGKQAGTFGLMGTFSTFFSHHMSTMEGGMVITDDEELYHILLCLRAHGWTRNLPKENLVCGTKSDNFFDEAFRFVLPGYNVRPLEMEGAIGQEQLKKLPDFIKERRANALYFQELFHDHPIFRIQKEIGESSWFGFSLVLRPDIELNRAFIVKKMEEHKIETRPIVAGNFAKNEVVKYFNHEIHGELTNAQWIDKNGLFVGNHQFSIREQLKGLSKALDKNKFA
ncbi:MAG TPA: DegT/DnrJ/EryC1/StrS family aminotransferase [Bacteriovoracaceae bacterium]|nr:DegT/DnrJ/EryC1/StrS family aminotransferase [Bacteriovoracaceae bacterium]